MEKVGDYKHPEYELVNDLEAAAIGGNAKTEKNGDTMASDIMNKSENEAVEGEFLGLRNDEEERLEKEINRRKNKLEDGVIEKEFLGLRNDEEKRLENEISRRKDKTEDGEVGDLDGVEEKIKRLNSIIEERKSEEQRLEELKNALLKKKTELEKSQSFFKRVLWSTPSLGIANEELENLENQIKISNERCEQLLADEVKLREDLGGEYIAEKSSDMEEVNEKLLEKQARKLLEQELIQLEGDHYNYEGLRMFDSELFPDDMRDEDVLIAVEKRIDELNRLIAKIDLVREKENESDSLSENFLKKFRSGSENFIRKSDSIINEYPELGDIADIDKKIAEINSTQGGAELWTGDKRMALLALRSARDGFRKFYLKNWMELFNFKTGPVKEILDMNADEYITNNEQDNIVKIFKKLKSTMLKQELESSGIDPTSGESVANWSKRLVNFILKSK